jgi:NADPH:quinone reductase-like Zn-dependent oxidoreductase
MAPINRAAWQVAKQVRPLVVKDAPYTKPGKNQIVVKSAAIAINSVEAMLQAMGPSRYPSPSDGSVANCGF